MSTKAGPCSVGVTNLIQDLQTVCNDSTTADVLFLIGPEEVEFYAHRLILWARCEHFRKYRLQFWKSTPTQALVTFKYPQYDPDVFLRVLKYLYTGLVQMREPSVAVVLQMSQDLGLASLERLAADFISQRLTSDNACVFLAAAMGRRTHDKDGATEGEEDLETVCLRYVEAHAEQCVRSEGWLDLSKEAVIKLLRSPGFCLNEDTVWRAVLSWAKYSAGVALDKKPTDLDSREKAAIQETLVGVVEHVKLFLVSSVVFAEEVEPVGVVSMETSLERYRYAALPKSVTAQSRDDRFLPRVSPQLFAESAILSGERAHFQPLLNQWSDTEDDTWRLLYRASRDGATAADFHRCCDGHAPTYVIAQAKKGSTDNICGGFSDVPWTSTTSSRGRFIPSHRAFLFSLVNQQDVPPTKFDVINSKLATLHHPDLGPVFGGGADLCIADTCLEGMECYSNLPHSFGGQHASQTILMGDYNFTLTDYEVFTISGET